MVDFKKLVDNRLKTPKNFDVWCKEQFPIFKWVSKTKTIVSTDRKPIWDGQEVTKRLFKNSKLTFFNSSLYFTIVLVSKTRVEIQTYNYYQSFEDGKEDISSQLYNLEVFVNGKHYKMSHRASYTDEGRWESGLKVTGVFASAYSNVYVYPNDWIKKLTKNVDFKYIDYSKLYSFNFDDLSTVLKRKERIEFAQKINAPRLAHEIFSGRFSYDIKVNGKIFTYRSVTMKWLKKHKNFFKNSERSIKDFIFQQFLIERGAKLVPGFEKTWGYNYINYLPKDIGLVKFQNWVLKNNVLPYDYADYKRSLEELDIEFKGKHNVMPSDFKQAHDQAVVLVQQKRDAQQKEKLEKLNKVYQERLKNLLKLEMRVGHYQFVLPKELDDLYKESYALNHCVKLYDKRVAEGKTLIIFVRDVSDVTKPLYTLEVREGRVVQLRGKRNCSAAKDAKQAVEKFIFEANKKHLFAA